MHKVYCKDCAKYSGLDNCRPDKWDMDSFGQPKLKFCEQLNEQYSCPFFVHYNQLSILKRIIRKINIIFEKFSTGTF